MTISPSPWSQERRAAKRQKIDKEADRAAARLGASGVVIIAFFEDGEYLHTQDGGKSPMPFIDLYKTMAVATQVMNESEEGGVNIN